MNQHIGIKLEGFFYSGSSGNSVQFPGVDDLQPVIGAFIRLFHCADAGLCGPIFFDEIFQGGQVLLPELQFRFHGDGGVGGASGFFQDKVNLVAFVGAPEIDAIRCHLLAEFGEYAVFEKTAVQPVRKGTIHQQIDDAAIFKEDFRHLGQLAPDIAEVGVKNSDHIGIFHDEQIFFNGLLRYADGCGKLADIQQIAGL